jgi:hypothetical protein
MTDLIKIRMLAMLDNEIEEVNGSISNELLWLQSSATAEEAEMFVDNVAKLTEYKAVLSKMREQVEEGTFNV